MYEWWVGGGRTVSHCIQADTAQSHYCLRSRPIYSNVGVSQLVSFTSAKVQALAASSDNYRVFLSTVTNKSSITDTTVESLTQFGYFSCSIHQVI